MQTVFSIWDRPADVLAKHSLLPCASLDSIVRFMTEFNGEEIFYKWLKMEKCSFASSTKLIFLKSHGSIPGANQNHIDSLDRILKNDKMKNKKLGIKMNSHASFISSKWIRIYPLSPTVCSTLSAMTDWYYPLSPTVCSTLGQRHYSLRSASLDRRARGPAGRKRVKFLKKS